MTPRHISILREGSAISHSGCQGGDNGRHRHTDGEQQAGDIFNHGAHGTNEKPRLLQDYNHSWSSRLHIVSL